MKISLMAARIYAGFRQKDLAEELGTTANTISRWENGNTAIPASMFVKYCKACGFSADDVYIPVVKKRGVENDSVQNG